MDQVTSRNSSMSLIDALTAFRSGKQPFSKDTIEVILRAVESSAGCDFLVKEDFVADADDRFHIHPTMIVSRVEFPGSTNRGPEPYESYPHFLALPHFVYTSTKSKNSEIATTVCPITYVRQPAHVVCPTCEIMH